MLTHTYEKGKLPDRFVVIGGTGFLGNSIVKKLSTRDVEVLSLGSADLDLTKPDAGERLSELIKEKDVVIAASAAAPAKNLEDLQYNVKLMKNIANGIVRAQPMHLINIGSDAVFADGPLPLNESSSKAPFSFHGLMHLTRELVFSTLDVPLVTIRPTLVYGSGDPHNGYGPNRFIRLALQNATITLFGEGEERRDHVFVEDVAEIVVQAAIHRSVGSLNATTGKVWSFREIASIVVELTGSSSEIRGSQRVGPMPHGGLRTFDNSAVFAAFPKLKLTPLERGLRLYAKASKV